MQISSGLQSGTRSRLLQADTLQEIAFVDPLPTFGTLVVPSEDTGFSRISLIFRVSFARFGYVRLLARIDGHELPRTSRGRGWQVLSARPTRTTVADFKPGSGLNVPYSARQAWTGSTVAARREGK